MSSSDPPRLSASNIRSALPRWGSRVRISLSALCESPAPRRLRGLRLLQASGRLWPFGAILGLPLAPNRETQSFLCLVISSGTSAILIRDPVARA